MPCIAGPGRDRTLIAACVLVLLGFAPGTAFDLIGKARGVKVPDTEGQRDWVDKFREASKTGGIHPARADDRCFFPPVLAEAILAIAACAQGANH